MTTDALPPTPAEGVDVLCGEPDATDAQDSQPAPAPEADVTGDHITDGEDPDPGRPVDGVDLDPVRDQAILGTADRLWDDTDDTPASGVRGTGSRSAAAPTLTREQATTILRRLGWRIRTTGEFTQAVVHFQRGWNLGPRLTIDGKVGPLTSAALRISEARRATGQPDASPHFSFHEVACKCGGRYSKCPRIWFLRLSFDSLEKTRARVPAYQRGMSIVSGCRCPDHNDAVGGVPSSQHMYGGAADITYAVKDATLNRWGLWAGIGRSASTHLVRHVDRRDVSGTNLTSGHLGHATIWNYSS